jgi:Mycothiol maleylpyruvate isomerase N-terminal domain
VSEWGRDTYGDPCRECGFSWSLAASDALALAAGLPSRLEDILAGARGDERRPALDWTVTSYVAHIGDNLRIWAERLAGIALGGPTAVSSYDENALASARAYETISLPGVLWTLRRSTRDWLEAVDLASPDLTMIHPGRGVIRLDDVVRTNAHDALHHEWDIERSLTTRSEHPLTTSRRSGHSQVGGRTALRVCRCGGVVGQEGGSG